MLTVFKAQWGFKIKTMISLIKAAIISWWSVSAAGPGGIVKRCGGGWTNAAKYQQTTWRKTCCILTEIYLSGKDLFLQQNSEAEHKVTQKWFQNNYINVFWRGRVKEQTSIQLAICGMTSKGFSLLCRAESALIMRHYCLSLCVRHT